MLFTCFITLQVRAFNLNGAGPFSKVRFARTNGQRMTKPSKNAQKLENKMSVGGKESASIKSSGSGSGGSVQDSEAQLYLIIGVSLGCVCLLLFSGCMVLTLWRRHRVAAKFSTTNASIHHKYQDTSLQLQINNTVYDPDLSQGHHPGHSDSLESSGGGGMHETSFSATEHSLDNGVDQYSQGSTIFMQVLASFQGLTRYDLMTSLQDSFRNLNVTNPSVDGQSLADEYVDEPSGLSWKRRRKSEEILG